MDSGDDDINIQQNKINIRYETNDNKDYMPKATVQLMQSIVVVLER